MLIHMLLFGMTRTGMVVSLALNKNMGYGLTASLLMILEKKSVYQI
jgi:hypothetical protein